MQNPTDEYVPFGADDTAPADVQDPITDETLPDEPTTDESEDQEPVPLALLENDEAGEDDGSDDDILGSPEFAELPEQNKKGIVKLVERAKAKEAQVQEMLTAADGVLQYARDLQDPETAADTLRKIQAEVYQMHGWSDQQPSDPGGDGESKYGLTYASDDVVFERAVDAAVKKALDAINPELNTVREMRMSQELSSKASQHVPSIKAQYGEWVTPDMVQDAIKAFPTLDPITAFNAKHAPTIAKKFAEYAKGTNRQPKAINPSGLRTGTQPAKQPGEYWSFGEVVAEEFSS
jgi:hypothetical protein